MLKGLFNAECALCKLFKPRCARIWFWPGRSAVVDAPSLRSDVLCEDCRRKLKGYFTVDPQHKVGQ